MLCILAPSWNFTGTCVSSQLSRYWNAWCKSTNHLPNLLYPLLVNKYRLLYEPNSTLHHKVAHYSTSSCRSPNVPVWLRISLKNDVSSYSNCRRPEGAWFYQMGCIVSCPAIVVKNFFQGRLHNQLLSVLCTGHLNHIHNVQVTNPALERRVESIAGLIKLRYVCWCCALFIGWNDF
jgi:hypothetical protein